MALAYTFADGETLTAAKLNAYAVNDAPDTPTWTPVLGGVTSGINIGANRYRIAGQILHAQIVLNVTGAVTSTSEWTLSLPRALASVGAWTPIGTATLHDVSASSRYVGTVMRHANDTTAVIRFAGTAGLSATLSPTVPFTWAAGDQILITLTAPLA